MLREYFETNRAKLVHSMITAVTRGELGQENLSCVNTALICMLTAHRRGQLPQLLEVSLRSQFLCD